MKPPPSTAAPASLPIDREAVSALLAELVRTPSHPGVPRQEEAVALILARFLADRGLQPRVEEVRPGRPNLLCTVAAPHAGRHLLLCGHTDTVPLNDGDPGVGFSAVVGEGRLHGRGAADMKGALAAMAGALAALAAPGALPAGAVTMAAVIDEELQSLGAEALVAGDFAADGAIVGEPTGNVLCLGHKGLEWIEVELRGRAAHGGTPERGVSAIVAAGRFLELIRRELQPQLAERAHPLLGPPTLNPGSIHGGDQPSTVAASCRITFDRRTVPGESWARVRAELQALLVRVEIELPGVRGELRRYPGGMATLEHVALLTPAESPLARTVGAAAAVVLGEERPPGAFPAWTDGSLLAGFGGIPTVVLGPGDLADAHSPRESVALAEVHEAAAIYAEAGRRFGEAP